MDNEIQSAINLTTLKIFETMFFISVDLPDNGEDQKYPISKFSSLYRGEIKFQGEWESGQLRFYIPHELILKMARNFMGEEKISPSIYELNDLMGELCNMVCGNFLSYLDPKRIWNISTPVSGVIPYDTMLKEISDKSVMVFTFWAEDYEIKTLVQLNEK